jgi:hypothetical protein
MRMRAREATSVPSGPDGVARGCASNLDVLYEIDHHHSSDQYGENQLPVGN